MEVGGDVPDTNCLLEDDLVDRSFSSLESFLLPECLKVGH